MVTAWFSTERALAWLLAAVCWAAGLPVHAASAVQHFTRAQIHTVAGGSFALPPAAPDVDRAAAKWQEVTLPHYLPRQIVPDAQDSLVTTWFRFSLDELQQASGTPYLYVPRWQTIGKVAVYGDGVLLERSHGGAIWNGYNHPLWVPLAEAGPPPREILIRIVSLQSAGGALSTVWVGERSALATQHFWRESFQSGIPEASSAAFLILGLFSLGVWLLRRRESIYLLYFASSVFSYIRCMHYYVGREPLPLAEDWFGWLTVNSAGWVVLTVYFFSFRMHGRRYPRLEALLVGLTVLTALLTIPSRFIPDLANLAPLAYLALFAEVIIVTVVMGFASWRSQSREGLLFSAWNLLNIPLMVHDWMLQNYRIDIEGIYLMPYSVQGTYFLFLAFVLRRYGHAMRSLDQANATLESRLREREAQLGASYEQLRQAEHRQVLNDERQRLIRDMHDGFGSSLISALTVVERSRANADVAQVLRECIDDLKLTIESLEPMDADLLLLLASLRYRVGPRLEQAGLVLDWRVEEALPLPWLTPGSALHILRILQEVFANVVKHAQASRITLSATRDGAHIAICVQDDGRGFDTQTSQPPTSRGLANLARRAAALQAEVHWHSTATGTRFCLRLPGVQPPPGPLSTADLSQRPDRLASSPARVLPD